MNWELLRVCVGSELSLTFFCFPVSRKHHSFDVTRYAKTKLAKRFQCNGKFKTAAE